jgi:hypothetical protein
MKKIILFFGFVLFVTSCVFAQAEDASALGRLISSYPIITMVVVIAHICLTFAVYKMKGGAWACFYFFLAPLVIFLLLFAISSGTKSNREDIHHHFH